MSQAYVRSQSAIEAAIRKLLGQIVPEVNLDVLTPDQNIREALAIDTFDYHNFLISLGNELGVEIPESDYEQLTTLSDLRYYLSVRTR